MQAWCRSLRQRTPWSCSTAKICRNGQGGKEEGIENGCINIFKTGELATKQNFGDFQIHVEWATPAVADGDAFYWGNSGVLVMGLYEVQIIESYAHQLYADGIAGAIYGQSPPMVNVVAQTGRMAELRHRF